ncbi:hypothetical protein LOAG_13634, partial [Loa loa]
ERDAERGEEEGMSDTTRDIAKQRKGKGGSTRRMGNRMDKRYEENAQKTTKKA